MKRPVLGVLFSFSLCIFFGAAAPNPCRDTRIPSSWAFPRIETDDLTAAADSILSLTGVAPSARIDSVCRMFVPGVSTDAMLEACGMIRKFLDTLQTAPGNMPALKANYYSTLYGVYNQVPDPERSMACADSALYYAEQLQPSLRKALSIADYAAAQQANGSIETAHKYFRRAIDEFEAAGGDDPNVSVCYFQLATDYMNMGDREGLEKCLAAMRELAGRAAAPSVAYDYYTVLSGYYAVLMEQEPSESWRDSMMFYTKEVVSAVKKVEDPWRIRINPVWAYFNVAVSYELYYDPPVIDSIELYLDMAETVNREYHKGLPMEKECDISLRDLRAWLYYHRGDYAAAERTMKGVVALLDEVERSTSNTVLTERGEAYSFFVELYENTGRLREALEYQKLLTENNRRRYDAARNKALHDLRVRYEVEKKEEKIGRLEEQNRTARSMLIFAVVLSAVFLGALLLAWAAFRLRKANLRQRLYEAALTAELSDRELSRLQRKLGGSSSRTVVESLKAALEGSKLGSEAAARYRAALEGLSVPETDRLLSSASEALTGMDRKYILCFLVGMPTADVCALFHVEPGSVYVVRSRIRKKFGKEAVLPF